MSEELDSLEKATRGLPVWVKSLVFIVAATALGFSTYKSARTELFPEEFASDIEQATIHKDVASLKEEVKAELREEYDKVIKQSNWSHQGMKKETDRVEYELRTELNTLKDSINVQNKRAKLHRQFNTDVNSIQTDYLWDQGTKITAQDDYAIPVRLTHSKDPYGKFSERYSSRVVYSLDRKSDDRLFVTPLNGEKQLIYSTKQFIE